MGLYVLDKARCIHIVYMEKEGRRLDFPYLGVTEIARNTGLGSDISVSGCIYDDLRRYPLYSASGKHPYSLNCPSTYYWID